MKRTLMIAAASLSILAACSADETDFKKSAEKFIESDDVESKALTTFTDATCTEPAKVEAGQAFTCSATDADGVVWDFQMQVTGKDAFEVLDGAPRA